MTKKDIQDGEFQLHSDSEPRRKRTGKFPRMKTIDSTQQKMMRKYRRKERKERAAGGNNGNKTVRVDSVMSMAKFVEIVYDLLPMDKRNGQKELLLAMARKMEERFQFADDLDADAENGIECGEEIRRCGFFAGEAPVGTGKSFVLLLLAFAAWYLYGRKTVLSTETKILQNQMQCKDFPAMREMLKRTANTYPKIISPKKMEGWMCRVIKGRANYLCQKQIQYYSDLMGRHFNNMIVYSPRTQEQSIISYSRIQSIKQAENVLRKDIDYGNGLTYEEDPIYDSIVASDFNCTKSEGCEYFPHKCRYFFNMFGASPLIIVNHSVVKAYLSMNDDSITGLLDDGQNQNKRDSGVSDNQLSQIEALYEEADASLGAFGFGMAETCKNDDKPFAKAEDDAAAEKAKAILEKKKKSPLLGADAYLFDEAHHLMGYFCGSISSGRLKSDELDMLLSIPVPYDMELKLRLEIFAQRRSIWDKWKELLVSIDSFINATGIQNVQNTDALPAATEAEESTVNLCDSKEGADVLDKINTIIDEAGHLNKMYLRVPRAASALLIKSSTSIESKFTCAREVFVNWAGGKNHVQCDACLNADGIEWKIWKKKSLGDDINSHMPNAAFAGFVSGTLLPGGRLDAFSAETGLPSTMESVRVDSPFRHDHILLWVPKASEELAIPNSLRDMALTEKQHTKMACDFCKKYVPPYVRSSLGGVLILSTSYSRMKKIARALEAPLKDSRRQLLVQGEMPRSRLITAFFSEPSSVLVGTNSFREGFDAPGNKLTWVILDKLPFLNPSDISYAKRCKMLKDSNAIQNIQRHSIDLMVFDLIQSLGRLERASNDWGGLTILDPRFYWLLRKGIENPLEVYDAKFLSRAAAWFELAGQSDYQSYLNNRNSYAESMECSPLDLDKHRFFWLSEKRLKQPRNPFFHNDNELKPIDKDLPFRRHSKFFSVMMSTDEWIKESKNARMQAQADLVN